MHVLSRADYGVRYISRDPVLIVFAAMPTFYLSLVIALVAGALLPLQAGLNNKMTSTVGSPLLAALVSFSIGTAALLIYSAAGAASLSGLAAARQAPPAAWLGGLLGAFFVTATASLLPRLGVALTFSLVVAGQMLVTIIIDHFGMLDVDVREISYARVAGVLLIVAGVILIRRF